MTALLGGSVLLLAVSAAALVYGWLNGEDTFIWGSIIATAASAILVVVAYVRSNKEPAVVTGPTGPGPEPTGDEATQAQPATTGEGEDTAATPAAGSEEQPTGEGEGTGATPAAGAGAAAGAAGAGAAGAGAAGGDDDEGGDDSAESSGPTGEVMGVPTTKKFHKNDCRYATVAGAEPMSRADAEAKGFEPCGVCKP